MPGTTINGTDQISASRATINANFALCAPLAAPTFTGDVTLPGTSIVKSTGNVGIGTTAPGALLHLYGPNASGSALLETTSATTGLSAAQATLRAKAGGFGSGVLFQSQETGTNTYIAQASIEAEGSLAWDSVAHASSLLRFATTAAGTLSERMRIDAAGNVGIGTTAPTAKLQVVGLPTYADNTAALAGGLTAGAFYRTSTGVLMVAY
jgi:hypothetical protein